MLRLNYVVGTQWKHLTNDHHNKCFNGEVKKSINIFSAEKAFYSKTCLKLPFKNRQNKGFLKTNVSLMNVESIAECSLWSILQYFLPVFKD